MEASAWILLRHGRVGTSFKWQYTDDSESWRNGCRYLDMIVTPGVTDMFRMRADATQAIRNTLVQNVSWRPVHNMQIACKPQQCTDQAFIKSTWHC